MEENIRTYEAKKLTPEQLITAYRLMYERAIVPDRVTLFLNTYKEPKEKLNAKTND